MQELNHKLLWGGKLDGKTAFDVVLKTPDSGIALKLQHIRGNDAILHGALVECTVSIAGRSVGKSAIDSFWRTVKVPDAEYALLELLKLIWPDDAEECKQAVMTLQGDIEEVIVNLHNIEINLDAKPDFVVDLRDGFQVGDNIVKRISGQVYTLGQSMTLLDIRDERPIEASFRAIAMTCVDADNPGRGLNMKNVQTMSPRDRKRIERQIEEGHNIADLKIETRINGRKAYGRVNLVSFL